MKPSNKKSWIELTKDGDEFVFTKKTGDMNTMEITSKEILRTKSAEQADTWKLVLRRKKRLNVRDDRNKLLDSFNNFVNENNEYQFDQLEDGTIRIFVRQMQEKDIGTINPGGVVQDGSMKLSKDGKSIEMHVHDNDQGLVGKRFQIPSGQLQSVFRINKEMLAPLGAVGTGPRGGGVYTVGRNRKR